MLEEQSKCRPQGPLTAVPGLGRRRVADDSPAGAEKSPVEEIRRAESFLAVPRGFGGRRFADLGVARLAHGHRLSSEYLQLREGSMADRAALTPAPDRRDRRSRDRLVAVVQQQFMDPPFILLTEAQVASRLALPRAICKRILQALEDSDVLERLAEGLRLSRQASLRWALDAPGAGGEALRAEAEPCSHGPRHGARDCERREP